VWRDVDYSERCCHWRVQLTGLQKYKATLTKLVWCSVVIVSYDWNVAWEQTDAVVAFNVCKNLICFAAVCRADICIIICLRKGSTKAYARNGYHLNSFPSYLPGGCRQQRHGYSRSGNCSTCVHCRAKSNWSLWFNGSKI